MARHSPGLVTLMLPRPVAKSQPVFCRVRLKKFRIRSGKYFHKVVQSGTRNNHWYRSKAQCYSPVVTSLKMQEDATPLPRFELHAFKLARIRVGSAPDIPARQVIQNRIGIPLRGARFLINQGPECWQIEAP